MEKISDKQKSIIKAKEYVFRLLNFRLRSEHEIREKLLQKNFSPEDIDRTIKYFKEFDLINDRQFAKKWISSRQSKPYGQNRIRFELKQKGIKEDVIEEELFHGFLNFSEETLVCQLVEKQSVKYRGIDPVKRKKRMYDFLIRRGYNNHVIMKVLNRYDDR
ncbi:MAG: regulatory protein RecX [Candidatus Omnitrophota bacterium]